jgi:hypothetical protein
MTVHSPQGMPVQSPHGMMAPGAMHLSDVAMSQDYAAQMDYAPMQPQMMPSMHGCMPSAGSLPAAECPSPANGHPQMGQPHANCAPHWDYRPVDLEMKLAPSVYAGHFGEKGRTDDPTISTESGSTSQVGDSPDTSRRVSNDNSLERALQDLSPANVQRTADHLVCCAPSVPEFVKAIEARAIADPSQTKVLAELVSVVNGRLDVGAESARLSSESIAAIDDRASMNRVRGVALLAAELYNRNVVQMSVMKEVFQKLVFSGVVLDNGARASCEAVAVAGGKLEQTQVGWKMVDYVLMRLREIRSGKYAAATRAAMLEVEQLRAQGWARTDTKSDSSSSRGTRGMETPKRTKDKVEVKTQKSPSPKSPKRFGKDAQQFVPGKGGKGGGKSSTSTPQRTTKR